MSDLLAQWVERSSIEHSLNVSKSDVLSPALTANSFIRFETCLSE